MSHNTARRLGVAGALAALLAMLGMAVASASVFQIGGATTITIEPPPAVKRAGGARLAQFKRGRTLVAQLACLACHRIGDQGHRGPGQNLTHVGARLRAGAIERAILHPSPPMPAFTRLPKDKLHSVVVFLSLLR